MLRHCGAAAPMDGLLTERADAIAFTASFVRSLLLRSRSSSDLLPLRPAMSACTHSSVRWLAVIDSALSVVLRAIPALSSARSAARRVMFVNCMRVRALVTFKHIDSVLHSHSESSGV